MGEKIQTEPFKIYFELKPTIEYVTIERIESNFPLSSYNVYYKIKYRGSDNIKVSVEEEYSSILKSNYLHEPFIANGVAKNISSPYYAWIDFTVENIYGKSIYTIELQPNGIVSDSYMSQDI